MHSITQKPVKDDIRKLHKDLYGLSNKSKEIRILKIPTMKYITSVGILRGNFYNIRSIEECNMIFVCNNRIRSYTVKEQNKNFVMSPFELEWGKQTEQGREMKVSLWVPDYVTQSELKIAMLDCLGSSEHPLYLEQSTEGLCGQLLHTGSYDEISQTIDRIKEYIEEQGYKANTNQYKEIHLSHVSIGWPEKTNMIIRIPIM
ncbi:hypothetical protein [Cohnella sp. WQ 127256]|uniref:hypothetical protein n=1 Tax=Cohnella sp. WQ 127256 TaxID=2938790 RepID=UPI002118DD20|nr:hypothetical protein [Cohnella sp. WQ 127256]